MRKTKSAQAQIIVTVLIILIVLAIVAGVSVFVNRIIQDKLEEGQTTLACNDVKLSIAKADAGQTNVSIERGVGGDTLDDVRVYVNGAFLGNSSGNIDELETKPIDTNYTLKVGDEVKVAAVLEGNPCEFVDVREVQ